MNINTRPIPAGCTWGVVDDGRLVSAHRHYGCARKKAVRLRGDVLSLEHAIRTGTRIGDRVRDSHGEAVTR